MFDHIFKENKTKKLHLVFYIFKNQKLLAVIEIMHTENLFEEDIFICRQLKLKVNNHRTTNLEKLGMKFTRQKWNRFIFSHYRFNRDFLLLLLLFKKNTNYDENIFNACE